jgi:hypothetical protein
MTTLGAGNRAVATPELEATCDTNASPISFGQLSVLRRANRDRYFGTRPGALGDALASRGLGIAVDGGGGVLLAGLITIAQPQPVTRGVALSIVEDAGVYDVRRPQREAALRALDARLSNRLRAPAPTVTLVVGAGDAATGPPRLRVALVAGLGFSGGRLSSDSTGRAPYVELIDVAPTVLDLLGVPVPDSMAGTPWQRAGGEVGVSELVDASHHAAGRWDRGGTFVRLFVGFSSVVAVAALAALRRGRQRAVEPACYFAASLPVSSYLINVLPWWRWSALVLGIALGLVAGLIAVGASVVARHRAPWGGAAVVAAVTGVVLAVDTATGTHLQLDGLLGDSTIVAGRFHGVGNTAFAVFAGAALISAAVLAHSVSSRGPRAAALVAGLIGVGAVALDGAPQLGNDVGGVLALSPAVVVLVLFVRETRLDRRVWAAAGAIGIAAALALLGYDVIAGRGHVGRFASDSSGGIRTTLDRRLVAMLHSWHSSPYVVMVAVALVVIAALARHSSLRAAFATQPAMRAGLIALGVCAVLGGVLNDSGAVVTGAAAAVGLPLLLAGCLRTAR